MFDLWGSSAGQALGTKPIERRFSWAPEIIASALGWAGVFAALVAPDTAGRTIAVGLIVAAGLLFGFRFFQRQHRLSVLIIPARNYAEICSNRRLARQTTLSGLGIVIQNAAYTIGPAIGAFAGVILFTMLALPGGAKNPLERVFAAGAAILCLAILIERLRTRLFYRACILPGVEMLIPRPDARQLGLELGLHIIRDTAKAKAQDTDWQRTLSLGLIQVGDLRRARGDRLGALAAYEEALPIVQKAAADSAARRDLETVLEKIRQARPAADSG